MKTTAYGQEIFVLVDDSQRWLSTMYAAMHKGRLPVDSLLLFNGELRASFALSGDTRFEILVTPTGSSVNAFSKTERYSIGFFGCNDPGGEEERILNVFSRIVSRFDPVMPANLSGPAFIGRAGQSPRQTLARMFPFITIEDSVARGIESTEILVRTTPACNQRCPFCSGPVHEGPSSKMIRDCLESISELMPGADVTLTGGEPTLRRSFMEEANLALSLDNLKSVQIQTNAISFAELIDPSLFTNPQKLTFFVSLHAMDAAIYDKCVGTSGHLSLAIRGIERILAAGHRIIINTVICSENIDHLECFVSEIVSAFGDPSRLKLHFSVLICQEWNHKAEAYLVKYSDVIPLLRKLTRQMHDSGMPVQEHFSSTHASIPPCFFSAEERAGLRRQLALNPRNTGYEDLSRPWVKAQRCMSCTETASCLGVPRAYARRFGLTELSPLMISEWSMS